MKRRISTRSLLRLFQQMRESTDISGIDADLRLLQTRDVDLSIRLGALLAFDALLIGTAIQPIVSSPGAPLALDAARNPALTLLTVSAVALLAVSSLIAVRAITFGEEFSDEGLDANPGMLVQRLYAAYCTSIDRQILYLGWSIRLAIAGLALMALDFALILGSRVG